MPVVEAVGVATGRTTREGEPLDDVLITEHLRYSLPYRALFSRRSLSDLWEPLLDALAQLLVRAHLAGFFWGDCSLSNTLFRRDAGALAAYIVDVETGEMHPTLSDGQRRHDLDIAQTNVAGELLDIVAATRPDGGWTVLEDDPRLHPAAVADDLCKRYEGLWHELTTDELIPEGEEWRVADRVQRLNDLGYDVAEIELVDDPGEDGRRFRLTTRVVEPGHHRRRLLQLTGLDVQENQARRLLNDILAYRTAVEAETGVALGEQIAAMRWMVEIFEPTLARVPAELRDRLEDAEIYQILEHRWFCRAGRPGRRPRGRHRRLPRRRPARPDRRTDRPRPGDERAPVIGGPDPEVT